MVKILLSCVNDCIDDFTALAKIYSSTVLGYTVIHTDTRTHTCMHDNLYIIIHCT
jgi:hypothetical protein